MCFKFLLIPSNPLTRGTDNNFAKLQCFDNRIDSYTQKTRQNHLALGNLAKLVFTPFIIKKLQFCKIAQLFFVSISLVKGKFEGMRETLKHKTWDIDDPNNPGNCCFKDENNPNQCLCNGNYTDIPNKSKTTMSV